MPPRFARLFPVIALSAGVLLSSCDRTGKRVEKPKEREEEAEATPTSEPTPPPKPQVIPRSKMEVSRLFNGMRVVTKLDIEKGTTATQERETPESYELQLSVKVKVPQAHRDLPALSQLNDQLAVALPWLEALLPQATIDPFYEAFYGRKLARLEANLERLDMLVSRHDFFDCETILQIRNPETKRTALLIQSEMDVDTDGSDGDRLPFPEGKDPYFQPMTSFKWSKQTDNPNPFLASREAKLKALQEELANAKGLGASRLQAMRDRVGAARYEVSQMRKFSFLISETDPYIVLPGAMFREENPAYTPQFGDYCAVIFGDVIYPAILGDAGPSYKMGEASLRLCKAINERSTAFSRPVSQLKVTYLVFPNSRDEKAQPPDMKRWRAKVENLLLEMGGYGGTLHAWETTARPVPTPTPTPSPTPTPTPSATASAESSPGEVSPEASPTPSVGSSLGISNNTPTATATPSAGSRAAEGGTPAAQAFPSPSPSSSPATSAKPSPTLSPATSAKPSPTPLPAASPKPSPTPSPAASPKPSPTPSPAASPKPSPTPSPAASPKPSPTPSSAASPKPVNNPVTKEKA